jgi:hypothetical protein
VAQTIELADVVASGFDGALRGVWTAMPGRVESYDARTQSANIQLTLKSSSVGESGDTILETIAVLNSVPVVHLGGGGFRQVFPVARGDTALVVFVNRAIAAWLVNGGIVDPVSTQHHSLSDGVALVGLRDHKHSLVNVPTDRMSIGSDTGATIEITNSEVRVGGASAIEPTLKATTFLSDLATLLGVIATQVGTSGSPASATSAGAAITGAIATFTGAAAAYTTTIAKVL